MKKKALLLVEALFFAFLTDAAENEIYVIKDGKMTNCEFVPSSDPVDESYEIFESTNAAGDSIVKVKNPSKQGKTGMLYLREPVDLSQTWNLEVDYYFDDGTQLTPDCVNNESIVFDLMADTLPLESANWKMDSKQKEYHIAHVSIDARMRDFYSYQNGDSILDNHGVGKLRKVTKYVYSSPLLPKEIVRRGDGNIVKVIFVSMFNNSGAGINGYIKNLKFVSDGIKPFYADKMTVLEEEGNNQSMFSNYVYASTGDGYADFQIGGLSHVEKKLESPDKMYGQQLFISNSTDGLFNYMTGARLCRDKGEQIKADFYDTEYGYLPYMKKVADRTDSDGVVADAQLRIPLLDCVEKNVSIAMRVGLFVGVGGNGTSYAEYVKSSKNIRFPVEYRFESGDAQRISSKTEWKQFRPTYTKGGDDFVDSIPTLMSMVYGDVELPSQEYSYITLRFIPNDVISYMFGDIRLTGDIHNWPRRSDDYVFGMDYIGNKIPVGAKSCCGGNFQYNDYVENVESENNVSLYPNPATDIVTITNEGVKRVFIYNLTGTLVATSKSNEVNVSGLPNGIYAVVAETETGLISGKIVKE
ncbi:MAG: T9SS type A sorting domain-containing protein [Paludibacteraceae bacterium]|nr:T9SS type A sorting domain-containing protein [Paludibacteraceae bacterium]